MATRGTVGNLLVQMRADLTGLKTDVKEMENTFKSSFSNIQTQVSQFSRGISAGIISALSIGSVIQFGKSIVDLGSKLADLSAQTGLSVQTLSGIKSIVEENGTTLDAFANGIFRLQKELGTIKTETDPAAEAIKALGLNLKELQNANPDQALKLITDALAKQENQNNRSALAFQLLGKSSRELVPAVVDLAGKLDDLRRKGLTPEDVKTLDDFGDALTSLSNQFKLFFAAGIAEDLRELNRTFGDLRESVSGFSLDLSAFTFSGFKRELLDIYEVILKVSRALNLTSAGKQFFTDQLEALQDLRGPQSHTPVEDITKQAPFKPPVDTAAIKKATDLTEQFIAALKKQQDALLINITELGGGGQAAKALALDFDFLAFKAKLAAEKIPLPKGIETTFQKLKEEILLLNIELGKTAEIVNRVAIDEKDWADTMEAINKASIAPQIAADNLELQRRDELAQMMAKDFDDVAAATREWADAEAKRLRDADMARVQDTADFAKSISGSLTQGIRNTLQGIETGQQSLSEGMKNLARNMALELQFALLDQTIMQPLKAGIEGFVMGLVGTLDDTIKNQMKEWGESAGKWLSQFFSDLFQGSAGSAGGGGGGGSGIFSGIGSWISSLFTFDQGGSIPFSRGLLAEVPHFDSGGLFIGHGGEYVMRKSAVDSVGEGTMNYINKNGRMPSGGGATQVSLDFQGAQIIPRAPWTTPEDVIKVGVKHLNDDGTWVSIIGHRMSRK